MTKKKRRAIENAIEEIEEHGQPTDWNIHSQTRVITDDMTDDHGNLIEEKAPDTEPPEGYELGQILPTKSPVVTVHELRPADD